MGIMIMSTLTQTTVAFLLLVLCLAGDNADGRALPVRFSQRSTERPSRSLLSVPPQQQDGFARKLAFLVEEQPVILEYHNGPILSASPAIAVYVVWYGTFSETQRSVVRDFFASLSAGGASHPTVASWWKLTGGYKDAAGAPVQGKLQLRAELSNAYSKGKSLANSDLEALVVDSLATFPKDPNGIYLVLTAADVLVEGFCMNSCASHFATSPSDATGGLQLPFGWVGNSATQCPGMCAWPYAKAEYGPNTAPLVAPNGDIGMDGIIINLGTILAGAATNPFNNGFFEGDAAAPVEAASACAANYGEGSYPGYPGKLLLDVITGASYNVKGVNDRMYLLPALWNPVTLKCTPPS